MTLAEHSLQIQYTLHGSLHWLRCVCMKMRLSTTLPCVAVERTSSSPIQFLMQVAESNSACSGEHTRIPLHGYSNRQSRRSDCHGESSTGCLGYVPATLDAKSHGERLQGATEWFALARLCHVCVRGVLAAGGTMSAGIGRRSEDAHLLTTVCKHRRTSNC